MSQWTRDSFVMQQFFQPYCRPKRGNAYVTCENYHIIQIPSSKYGPKEVRIDLDDLEPVSNDFALTTEATERLLLSDTTSIWCKVI